MAFIACFSAEPDIENQWKNYARGERGLCIGFDASRMPHSRGAVDRFTSGFMPVVYNSGLRREGLRRDIEIVLKEVDRCAAERPHLTDRIVQCGVKALLQSAIGPAAIIYKTEEWCHEKEWRIMCFVGRKGGKTVRTDSAGKRYVEVELAVDRGLPPVDEVIIGDRQPDCAVAATEGFLRSLGFGAACPMPRVRRC